MLRAADGASLLTAANATDTQSFDSGNVCATYGDRGFVFVKNNCFSPITVGLEVRTYASAPPDSTGCKTCKIFSFKAMPKSEL